MDRKTIYEIRKVIAYVLILAMMVGIVLQDGAALTAKAAAEITVNVFGGYEEGAYVEWAPVQDVDGYVVSVSKDNNTWREIDDELIRQYPGYYRADALGLTAGKWYLKIEAAKFDSLGNKQEPVVASAVKEVTVTAHDRSGYGWVKGTSSGAYKEDGSLRDNAQVLYITESTKNTVTLDVVTSTKGATTTGTGLQEILNLYKKNLDTRPLDVRLIGNITDFATMEGGDIMLSGSGAAQNKRVSCGITIEGVGKDAVANGWGLRIKNASNVEVRNIGFMNCDSGEGDNVSLQQDNDHVWVHHCDLFYGGPGGDKDQAKGDGALDTKKSGYITLSYNHFWDSGKSSLCGMKSCSNDLCVTYHHNWFDHSDSRHPRVRFYTTHVYNNYYDGVAKYGVGGAMGGASIFVENNYFRNCPYPMLISMQGSDIRSDGTGTFSGETGSIIKSYGNVMKGAYTFVPYSQNATEFDAYDAKSRDEKVPATVKSKKGECTYSNFDTASDFYSYTPDAAEDVPAKVKAHAGRVNGGDFTFTFTDTDDALYSVNTELKTKLTNYTSTLVKVGGINGSSVVVTYTVTFVPGNGANIPEQTVVAGQKATMPTDLTAETSHDGKKFGGWYNDNAKWNFESPVRGDMTLTAKWLEEGQTPEPDPDPDKPDPPIGGGDVDPGEYAHNFTTKGKTSSFYKITGNLSTSKGTASYNGSTLTQCLKMESSTNITFTAPSQGLLTLVFGSSEINKGVYINEVKNTTDSRGIVEKVVSKGTVTITKKDGINLFYMNFEPDSSGTGDDDLDEFTVTFDYNDGEDNEDGVSTMTDVAVTEGDTVKSTDIPTPVRDGYEFIAWTDASGNTVPLPFRPAGDVTLKAKWQEVEDVELDPNKTYNMELIALDIPGGTYTSDFTKNGFTIHANDAKDEAGKATGSVSVDVTSAKKIKDENNKETSYTGRLKLSGAGAKDYRSISFTTTGAATLNMACIVATTGETRTVHVAAQDAQGELVDITTGIKVDNNEVSKISINSGNYVSVNLPEAGTYYIYADGGVNIYALKVTYPNGANPVYCTVNFDAMGGVSVDSQRCLPGEACVEPGETIKDGYLFDGWYTDAAGTKKYDFSTPVTRNVTLFAKWKLDENPGKYLTLDMKDLPARDYKEVFSKNGFTFAASESKSMSVEASGATVEGVNYTQKLKFNGTGDASARNLSFTIEGNATLTVVVESANTGTARELVVTNGTAAQDQNITSVTTAAKYTKELTAGTWKIYPKKDGMNIYYISVEGAGVVEYYTITIDKQNGTRLETKTIIAGKELTEEDLPAPTKAGDTFLGWADENGNLLPVPYTPARSMTITAKWQSDSPVVPKKQYTITIDKQNGTAADTKTINEGDELTAEDLPTPTKEGYKFLGWADEAGNLLTLPYPPTGDMTITAKWQSESTQPDPGPDPGPGPNPGPGTEDGGDTSFDGEDWKKVANPVIVKADYTSSDGKDKLTVIVNADVSDKGGTSLDVTVKKEGAAAGQTKTSTAKQSTHTFEFAVSESGNYEVIATLKREGMPDKTATKIVPVNKPGTSSGRDGLYVKLLDEDTDYVYSGSAIKPAIEVYNGDELLTEGTDYTVKYSNNVKAAKKGDPKAPTITVTGKGRYTGKTTQTFTIEKKDLSKDLDDSENGVVIGGWTAGPQDGTLIVAENTKISPILVYKGVVLKAGAKKDFVLETKITKPALSDTGATITIKGAENNFTGTLTLTLDVKNKNDLKKISSVKIDKKAGLVYDGKKKEVPGLEVKAGKDTVAKENYVVVYNGNRTSAGTQKFTVVGLGIYTGSKTSSFKIDPKKNAPLTVTNELADASGNVSCTFNSAGVTFNDALTVKDTDLGDLVLGKDYKVSYSGNKKVGTGKYTVTFLGNYKGNAAIQNTFTIDPANLSLMAEANDPSDKDGLYLKSADKAYGKKAAVIKSAPFVLVDGVALKSSDYTVKYYLDETKKTEMKGKDKVDLSTETSTTVWVEITGKKNYTGTVMTSFEVVKPTTDRPMDISKAKIKVADKKVEYTGEAVYPSSIEVKVGKNSPVTLNYNAATDSWSGNDNFDVLVVNNIAKGKATVIVTGTGTNVGSKTATFNVVSHNLKNEKTETFWEDFQGLQSVIIWPGLQSAQ